MLPPLRDERNKSAQRGWRLAAASVIQKRAGERRAPIVEHADQHARPALLAHIALERRPEADSVEGRAPRQSRIARDQLARRRHFYDSTGLLELPVRHPAAAEPGPDRGMIQQVLGVLWPPMLRNILRRCHNRITLRRSQRDRDHVLRQMLAIAHARIEAGGNDIDKGTVADNL